MTSTTPLGAVAKGLLAGAVGTAAMTGYQMVVVRACGAEPSTVPGEIGKRVIEGVFQRRVREDWMSFLNNAVHFTYGTSWGVAYGIWEGSRQDRGVRHGVPFGLLVWGASLVELPAMKLAAPVWRYPPKELALDVSYHLVYGACVGAAFAVIER